MSTPRPTLPSADNSTPELTRTQVALLRTEVRTLQERLIIQRARDTALEQKVHHQQHELEKYLNTLFCLTEELRKSQNLANSFRNHVGEILVKRGRFLLGEFQRSGIRGRVHAQARITEFIDFLSQISEAVYAHPDWQELHAQLAAIRALTWQQLWFDRQALGRAAGHFLGRFNPLARSA